MATGLPIEAAAAALARRLGDEDDAVRVAAGDALAAFGAPGTRLLGEAIGDESPVSRAAAIGAIGRAKIEASAAASVARLNDPVSEVRLAAVAASAALGVGGSELLGVLADDADATVRAAAAGAIASVKVEGGEDALVGALGDEAVREAALQALARIGWTPDSPAGAAALALARRDWDGLVAVGPAAVPLLSRTVADRSPDKSSVELRGQVIETLARIGGKDAAVAAEGSLGDMGGPVRAAAARAVGVLHPHTPKRAAPILMGMVADDAITRVRVAAAGALGLMRHRAARDVLQAAAEGDPEQRVRLAAAEALAMLGLTGLLVAQLESQDPEIRRLAAVRLGEAEAEEAIDPLIERLGDAYATVRAAAFEALSLIGWTPVGVKRTADDPKYIRWMSRAEQERRTGLAAADQEKLLAADLKADESLVRQAALEALRARGGAGLWKLALPLLEDPVREVRRSAAETLQSLGKTPSRGAPGAAWRVAMQDMQGAARLGEAALPALIRALREHPSDDRANAARTLAMVGGPEAVEALQEALGDPEPFVQVNTALALGALAGEAAVPALVPMLGRDHSTIRTAAGRTLATLGGRGIAALVAALGDEDAAARETAARSLAVAGAAAKPGLEALAGLLGADPSPSMREAAAMALGEIPGDHSALAVAATGDAAWRVRRQAVLALGATAPKDAARTLVRCLADGYRAVREATLRALDQVGWKPDGPTGEAMLRLAQEDWKGLVPIGEPAVELLGRVVQDKGRDAAAVERRVQALTSIEAIGEQTGAKRCGAIVTSALADVAGPVRAVAARAAGRLELKGCAPRLLEMAQQDPNERVRLAAAAALGRAGDKSLVEPLAQLAREAESPFVQLAASRALAGPAIGEIAMLLMALRSPEAQVRRDAAADLGEIQNPEAIEPLIGALGDAVPRVRAAARASLEQLGWEPVGIKGDESERGYRRWLTLTEIGGKAGAQVVQGELLVAALKSDDAEVRRGALEALAERGDAGPKAAIARLLEDRSPDVRKQAAHTLLHLGVVPAKGAAAAAARVALGEFDAAVGLGAAAIEPLLRALRERGPTARVAALGGLAKLGGDEAAAAARGALADGDAGARRAAVVAVAALDGEKGVPAIAARVEDEDGAVRAAAAQALCGLGKPGHEAAKAALASGRWTVRQAVVTAVGALEKPGPKLITALVQRAWGDDHGAVRAAAVPILARAMGRNALDLLATRLRDDGDPEVRLQAATAIGALKPKNAAELLVPALGDDYGEVRAAVLESLRGLGWEPDGGVAKGILALAEWDWATLEALGKQAAPLLAGALRDRGTDGESRRKRAEALGALARIGGKVAATTVLEAFEDPAAAVRAEAANAAARLGLKTARDGLVDLLERDRDARVRARAASAIGAIGLTDAAPSLSAAASQDDDSSVRVAAATALAGPGIGNIERLIVQLTDDDPELRRIAAMELGKLRARKALDPLIAALADAFASVRAAAKEGVLALDWIPFGVRRTVESKGYDRWVLRQELSPRAPDTPQLAVLLGAVTHDDPKLRAAIAEALGLLGGPKARKALKALASDLHPHVAATAHRALAD